MESDAEKDEAFIDAVEASLGSLVPKYLYDLARRGAAVQEAGYMIYQDGTTEDGRPMWCAVHHDFINLQESPAAFHDEPWTAIKMLLGKDEWPSIETAPRDGRPILITGGKYFWGDYAGDANAPLDRVTLAHWDKHNNRWEGQNSDGGGEWHYYEPTNWTPVPLPPPPEKDTQS